MRYVLGAELPVFLVPPVALAAARLSRGQYAIHHDEFQQATIITHCMAGRTKFCKAYLYWSPETTSRASMICG